MAPKPLKPLKKYPKPLKPLNPISSLAGVDEGNYEGTETVKVAQMSDDIMRAREANRKQREGLKELNDSDFWLAIYFPFHAAKIQFVVGMGWADLLDCNLSEYLTICFQNRDQKEAFLLGMNWAQYTGGIYIDGQVLATHESIDLFEVDADAYQNDILDGEELAALHKIAMPKRKRDYDVGKLDKEAQTLL